MLKRLQYRQWLYLLVALLLAMQSFALWHDTIHPFHIANAHCAQLAAVSHTPSDIPTLSLLPLVNKRFIKVATTNPIISVEQQLDNNLHIRAPPIFS